MEVLGGVATKGHEIRLDDARPSTGSNAAVWRAFPTSIRVVGSANGYGIHAIRGHLYACVSGYPVTLSVVADGDGHKGVAVGENFVNDRCPGMNVGVLNWKVRTKAQIQEF